MFAALTLVFFLLVFRLYDLQIAGHEFYSAAREAQRRGVLELRPPRGLIVDARGTPLAVSAPVGSIAADPSRMPDRSAAARLLAAALGRPASDVEATLSKTRRGSDGAERPVEFVWLQRHASEETTQAVSRLNIPGLHIRREFDRVYPYGSLLAHTLGIVNIDDVGGEGLERTLDAWLGGADVRRRVDVDGRRRARTWPELPLSGSNAQLTIDARLQRVVEKALDGAVERHKPRWAVAVLLDPRTGAIQALANRPTFDPSRPVPDGVNPAEAALARRNLAIIAPYEPGSTWKPFAVAGALEAGLVRPDSRVDCENGVWKCGARVLHDHKPYGMLTVTDVIAKSSNIGAAKVGGVMLGAKRLWRIADAFGFGKRTGIDLPLEDAGTLYPLFRWTSLSVTSLPMGHEIAATPLQLVTAMAAIANGGRILRPYVVERITAPDGTLLSATEPQVVRQAVGEKTCAEMRKILREAVRAGTGTKADVEGLDVCGKTGTTRKVDPATGRYTREKHTSSFLGFAPQERARVCLIVVVDEPQGEYYGGAVAAPIAAEILREGMKYVR
ncbi:MAG: penicillin-binding protein 2 [Planctomycetes bacterium]|nr:penicillin-binding protein 2 [Planctomycetota bacterium]